MNKESRLIAVIVNVWSEAYALLWSTTQDTTMYDELWAGRLYFTVIIAEPAGIDA